MLGLHCCAGFSLVVVHRFSSYGTQTPEHMGPVVVAHGLFSYGVLTFLLRGI